MDRQTGKVWYDKAIEGGKFIQVYLRRLPYLKIGDKDSFHGVLLMELLKEQEIPFRLIDDDVHCQSPPLKADDGSYELVGAGLMAALQFATENLCFMGEAYPIKH
jgi:hypothetical protein